MPLVTPGYTFAAGETITEDKLNQAANPTVTQTPADAQAIAVLLSTGKPNWFLNADLSQWTRTAGPINCTTGVKTLAADFWWVRPTGGGVSTYAREVDAANNDNLYRAKVAYGSGTVSAVEFGQNIEGRLAAALAAGFTVAMEIENQSGVSMTPQLRVSTANALDDFSAVTLRETIAGVDANGAAASIATNTTAVVYFKSTPTGTYASQLKNGAEVSFYTAQTGGYFRVYSLPKLEGGQTATAREQERVKDTEDTEEDDNLYEEPLFVNGALDVDAWHVTTATPTTSDLQVPRGWFVRTAAGTLTSAALNTTLPAGGPSDKVRASLRLTGDAGVVGIVTVSQRVPACVAAHARQSLAFQCYVYNNTGAAFTPTLRIKTANAADNFSALTARVGQALQECADGAWTLVSHVFDASAHADYANGFAAELEIPAGSMVAADVIDLAAFDLRRGLEVPELEIPARLDPPAPLAAWRNLKIDRAGATTLNLTADELILTADDGTARRYRNVNIAAGSVATLDTGAGIGASTVYNLYVAGKDDGYVLVTSASASTPTLPAGYKYYGRVSGFVSTAGSQLPSFFAQRDRWAYITPVVLFAGALTNAFVLKSLATLVPVTAIRVAGVIGVTTTTATNLHFQIAVDSGGLCYTEAGFFNTTTAGSSNFWGAAPFVIGLITAQSLWVREKNSTADCRCEITGYEIS